MSESIIIADNQYLTRQGLRAIVKYNYGFKILEANSQFQIIEHIDQNNPSLLIIDYLPKEFDVITIKEHFPDLKILAISHDYSTLDKVTTMQAVTAVVKSGIESHITKDCSEDEFIDAIKATAEGNKFFCNQILNLVVENKNQRNNCDYTSLTPREIDVVKCTVSGLTAKETAEKLFVSHHTVNTHRKNIMKKLGFKSPQELTLYAVNTGLITG